RNIGLSMPGRTPNIPIWAFIDGMARNGSCAILDRTISTLRNSCRVLNSSLICVVKLLMDLPLNYLPRLPRRKDWRIGCIGAGFIMRDCHLVAYPQAGFNPIAIASRNPENARAVAELRGVPKTHAAVDDLLADCQIEVLDIAVPPDVQPEIIR